jgi:hypothetical protein
VWKERDVGCQSTPEPTVSLILTHEPITLQVEYWIRSNNAQTLYSLGSQPPLTLAIHGVCGGQGRCQTLPREWATDCLGCNGAGRIKTQEQMSKAKLLVSEASI